MKEMWTDETAVSPVIAVVLMIAVTVVLGGVVGAFVFGVGQDLNQPTPNAQITFDYNSTSQQLSIEHAGGKKLMTSNTGQLRVTGSFSGSSYVSGDEWNATHFSVGSNNRAASLTDTVEIGETIWTTEDGDGDEIGTGDEIQLVWVAPDGSKSDTLGTFEVP